jgi:hypothetical protein
VDNPPNVDKSSPKSRRPGQFVPGDPRRMQARGPKKGAPNAGRPRDEWKAALAALVSRDSVLEHVRAALDEGPSHPWFDRAMQYATDHGYGKATQPVEHSGPGGGALAITVELIDPPVES